MKGSGVTPTPADPAVRGGAEPWGAPAGRQHFIFVGNDHKAPVGRPSVVLFGSPLTFILLNAKRAPRTSIILNAQKTPLNLILFDSQRVPLTSILLNAQGAPTKSILLNIIKGTLRHGILFRICIYVKLTF